MEAVALNQYQHYQNTDTKKDLTPKLESDSGIESNINTENPQIKELSKVEEHNSKKDEYYKLKEQDPENKKSPYVQLFDWKFLPNNKSLAEVLQSHSLTRGKKRYPNCGPFDIWMNLYFDKTGRDIFTFPLRIPKYVFNATKYIIQNPKKIIKTIKSHLS